MADFVGTDPRGIVVVLHSSTWESHIKVKHHDLAEHHDEVANTLVSPDKIIDNPKDIRKATHAGPRSGIERYVRFSETLNTHIVVPVRSLNPDEATEHGAGESGGRACLSAYTNPGMPIAKVRWSGK